MASPSPLKRNKASQQYCYYEGFLEKRSPEDKDFIKYWAALRGNTIFFHSNGRSIEYVEKLELDMFQSLVDDNSKDANQKNVRMTLKLQNKTVKLKVASFETKELWKGFILAVTKLEVPTNLALLPGQIHRLTEVVNEEKERLSKLTSSLPPSPTPSSKPATSKKTVTQSKDTNTSLPQCFYRVSRLEAEALLERHANQGNMVLRPAGDNSGVAVSTCQKVKGTPEYKHYKIRTITNGYIIDIEPQVFCKTLQEVVEYFVVNTNGTLVPLFMDTEYENNICYIANDEENGERVVKNVAPTALNKASDVTNTMTLTLANKSPRQNHISHFKEPEPKPEPVEQEYLNEEDAPNTITLEVPRVKHDHLRHSFSKDDELSDELKEKLKMRRKVMKN
ncbi:signal-transducing adaptor protein 2 isoform X2 [Protopterus annectens]|uniref:signal-transducing adaptor protein 2 isoform X2 n=1 Tax=Protopterus annectens TaxID=7888 RepID=UPI001CF9A5FD|nr:signal-transducing adaptor protein 2 isoform X2 [Protopterus annectens]